MGFEGPPCLKRVRDADHLNGLPRLAPRDANRVMLHNGLRRVAADFAWAVYRGGGEVTFENPSDRGDVSQPHVYWEAKAGHASLFNTDELLRFAATSGATRVTAPFCAFGADVQKYFTLLATPGAALVLEPVKGLVCVHRSHPAHAFGVDAEGARASSSTAPYPAHLLSRSGALH